MCIRINKELENSLVVPVAVTLVMCLCGRAERKKKAVLCFDVLGKSWGKVWSCGVWALLCCSHLCGCGQVFSSLCDLNSPSDYQALRCKAHWHPSVGLSYLHCFAGGWGWLLCPSTLALKDKMKGKQLAGWGEPVSLSCLGWPQTMEVSKE